VATVSGGSTSERFGFIQKFGQALGVKYLCSWLNVSRSGFYAWRDRTVSARALSDANLLLKIKVPKGSNLDFRHQNLNFSKRLNLSHYIPLKAQRLLSSL